MKFTHDGCKQPWLNIGLLIPSPLGYAGRARRTLDPRFLVCSQCTAAKGRGNLASWAPRATLNQPSITAFYVQWKHAVPRLWRCSRWPSPPPASSPAMRPNLVVVQNNTAQTVVVYEDDVATELINPGLTQEFGTHQFRGTLTFTVRYLCDADVCDQGVLAERTFTWEEMQQSRRHHAYRRRRRSQRTLTCDSPSSFSFVRPLAP